MNDDKILVKNQRFVVCVSYGDYMIMHGGVSRYLLEYSRELMNNDISIVFIYPKTVKSPISQKTLVKKYGCKVDERDLEISTDIESIIDIVKYNLKYKKLVDVHIHHFKDIEVIDIESFVELFEVPIKFFVHDYYCVCENQLLLNDEKNFCQVKCEEKGGCKYCANRQEHFGKYKKFFCKFKNRITIIAPSECAKTVWELAFGKMNRVMVLEHQIPVTYEKKIKYKEYGEQIKVAYLGNSRFFKGYEYWTDAINKNENNICFIEYSDATKPSGALQKKGYFSKDNLMLMRDKMIEDKIDVVVLWSIWPETYSYTFFEALETGAVILTNDEAGNIPCMVDKYQCGIVKNRYSLSEVVNDYDLLIDLCNDKQSGNGYRFIFNNQLISSIKDEKIIDNVGCEDIKIRNYRLFSFVYKFYNWLRIKVIKV